MNRHNPEPWRTGHHNAVVCDTPTAHKDVDNYKAYGGFLIAESIGEHNAKRVVECVNACANFENAIDLRKQRNYLLIAMIEIRTKLTVCSQSTAREAKDTCNATLNKIAAL